MANIALTALSVCCLGLGYQYVYLVRYTAVLATEEFLDGRLGRSSDEDVGEAQGLVILSSESSNSLQPHHKDHSDNVSLLKARCVLVWVPIPPTYIAALNSELTML